MLLTFHFPLTGTLAMLPWSVDVVSVNKTTPINAEIYKLSTH